MSKSETLKLARLQCQSVEKCATLKLAGELVKNPVVEFTGGLLLIAALEQIPTGDEFFGMKRHILEGEDATIARTFLASMIIVQQLAPAAPALGQFVTDLLNAIKPNINLPLPLPIPA